ncbi:MAG: hypothetical protein IH600_09545 [Bacteroidetes bacterium]|nr:hypothetical protein [Bacteroidota bacterium]
MKRTYISLLRRYITLVMTVSLLQCTALLAQEETDVEAGRTMVGLNLDGTPGLFTSPSPAVARAGHLVVGSMAFASLNAPHGFRLPFAMGYGIARYSQAFASFLNGKDENQAEIDRVLAGVRIFLGVHLDIALGVEAYGTSLSRWQDGKEQQGGIGGGIRVMAAKSLPIGIGFSMYGGAVKEALLPVSGQIGAALTKSVFDQTLVGIEAEWQPHSGQSPSFSLAAGLRIFLFEHLQVSLGYQRAATPSGTHDRRILAGIAFSSDILSTASTERTNETPPGLPDLEQLDAPVIDE